jgi:hypothetical protein
MAKRMHWETLGLGSVAAFALGLFTFGLFGAVILTAVVLVILSILRFR